MKTAVSPHSLPLKMFHVDERLRLSSLVRAWYVLIAKYSTTQFSVTVPCGGCSQGCHGYLLPCARALGTSARDHLLVMSLIFVELTL